MVKIVLPLALLVLVVALVLFLLSGHPLLLVLAGLGLATAVGGFVFTEQTQLAEQTQEQL